MASQLSPSLQNRQKGITRNLDNGLLSESCKMAKGLRKLVVLTHDVKIPLYDHHSSEFRNRILYLQQRIPSLCILSINRKKEGNLAGSDNALISGNARFLKLRGSLFHNSFIAYQILKKHVTVFADTQMDLLWFLPAIMLSRKKVILLQQGYDLEISKLYHKERGSPFVILILLRIIYYFLNLISYASCSAILCVNSGLSSYVKSHLSARAKTAVYVVPQSIPDSSIDLCSFLKRDVARQIPFDIRHTDYVCFVGRFDLLKHGDIVLKAFSQSIHRENLWLVMIGDGPQKKEYLELAQSLSISDRVLFTGWIDKRDVLCLLSESKALVFPSVSEGSSNTVYEALAVGCPVIAHRYPGIESESLDKAIIPLSTLHPNDYSYYIERVLTDQTLRANLAQNGRILLSKNLISSAEDRFSLILKLIKKHAPVS